MHCYLGREKRGEAQIDPGSLRRPQVVGQKTQTRADRKGFLTV